MKKTFEVGELVRWTLRGCTDNTGSRSRGLGIILDRMDRTPTAVKEHYFFDFTTDEDAPHAYKVHWYGIKKDISLGLLSSNTEWCVTSDLTLAQCESHKKDQKSS